MPPKPVLGTVPNGTAGPAASVRDVLFPRHSLSATEFLIVLNIAVAIVLAVVWKTDYPSNLRAWADDAWAAVAADRAYGWWLPTIFLHAGPGHLARNMIALLAASGAVEFVAGGRWSVAVYVITGLGAAAVSYLGHNAPPLSVGASGAIMGLFGCIVTFVIRRRREFNYAQQWKVWRVYVPLFVLFLLPVIVNADVHAHAGGFACGLVLGLWLPSHPRVRALAAVDPLAEDAEEPEQLIDP